MEEKNKFEACIGVRVSDTRLSAGNLPRVHPHSSTQFPTADEEECLAGLELQLLRADVNRHRRTWTNADTHTRSLRTDQQSLWADQHTVDSRRRMYTQTRQTAETYVYSPRRAFCRPEARWEGGFDKHV